MTYKVIGLMSGSSLDGLDIAYVHLTEQRGQWSFELKAADCIPYSQDWLERLKNISSLNIDDYWTLDADYGMLLGQCVQDFRKTHELDYGIDFIASHGHTALHNPKRGYTAQIGNGAAIAAITGLSVITDLRAMDVALGGQGAPIIPIGDKLLFPDFDYWLNLGGIANITMKGEDGRITAFDVCACNQILNKLANREGNEYDDEGKDATLGKPIPELLAALNKQSYYQLPAPKSLSNDAAMALGEVIFRNDNVTTNDLLNTQCRHIATQVARVIETSRRAVSGKLLVSGGGAMNKYLVQLLNEELTRYNVEVIVPERDIIQYKEAIVMAFIGALRWRNEVNVLASVTGGSRDSIGGAMWVGN